jgi:serine protease Do
MKIKAFIAIILTMLVVSTGINTRNIADLQTTQKQIEQAKNDMLFNALVFDACVIVTDGWGYGSGVAIAPDLILTAGHCADVNDLYILDNDGNRHEVINQWQSDKYDIGFLQINGTLSYLPLGDMPELLDEVYLIGTPANTAFQNNISKGVVTNIDVDWFGWIDAIITDASGWFGNSGGPLLNMQNEIVGICVGGPGETDSIVVCESIENIKKALKEYNNAIIAR